MAQNPRNRWKSGTRGAPPGMSAKDLYWGRGILTALVLLLPAVLIYFVTRPTTYPRVWFVTVTTGPQAADQVSLPLPPSAEKIPESAGNAIGLDQLDQALSSLKDTRRAKIEKDTVFTYVTANGFNHPKLGPCLVTTVPGDVRGDISQETERKQESGVEQGLLPVKEFLNSVLKASEAAGTVIVTLDCSRTLKTPRWGWTGSGGFTQSQLEAAVNEIANPKLWVICATGATAGGELGIWQREQSFPFAFQAAREKLLDELDAKKSHVTVEEFFAELSIQTKKLSNDRMNPWKFHVADKDQGNNAAKESPAVAWYRTEGRPSPAGKKSKTPAKTEPEEESTAKSTSPKVKKNIESNPALPGNLARLWDLCDQLEAFKLPRQAEKQKTDDGKKNEAAADGKPAEEQRQAEHEHPERSPLMLAPHLWRRLKAELAALEFHALSGSAPQDLSKYEAALQALKTWKFGSGKQSEEVFDYIQRVGSHDNYQEHPFADAELADACRAYAEALYVAVELIQLEDRLASVSNADHFSLDQQDFAKGVQLLQMFYDSAFPAGEADSLPPQVDDKQIVALLQTGKDLRIWTQNAVDQWTKFGNEQVDDNTSAVKHAAAWLTLDVLLTSGLWSAETRTAWRSAQKNWDGQQSAAQILRPAAKTMLVSRMGELSKIIRLDAPAIDDGYDFSTWLFSLAGQVRATKEPRRAHYLATLCDQRDWKLGDRPFRMGPTIRPAPRPEKVWLQIVKEPVPKPPVAADPEKPAPESKPQEYNLDVAEEIRVRVQVERKSGDGTTPLPKRDVKLQASQAADWLKFDEQLKVVSFPEGESKTEISWTVRMAEKRERESEQEAPSQRFTVRLADEPRSDGEGRFAPWTIDAAKAEDSVNVVVRNRRSVLLACRDKSVVSPRDPASQLDHVYRIELPASTEYRKAAEWELTNFSPIAVTVDVKLYRIPAGADPQAKPLKANWPWPWGRVPMRAKSGQLLRDWAEKRISLQEPFAAATVQLGVGEARTKLVPWKTVAVASKPSESTAKPISQTDVTHGLCCLMQFPDAPTQTRSWMELVPVSPRDELSKASKGAASLNGELESLDEDRVVFRLPNVLEKDISLKWRVERQGQWSTDILKQIKTEKNGNDFEVFLDWSRWPRALHWSVPTSPQSQKTRPVELRSGQQFWIMFQRFEFLAEGAPAAYDRVQFEPDPGKKIVLHPWPSDPEAPLIFQYNADKKLSVRLETDALTNSFTLLDGESAEIRLEEMEGKTVQGTHFARRADRDWTTRCAISPPENPDSLQFEAAISDFEGIPLSLRPGITKLRASIYRDARDETPKAEETVKLFFDNSNPVLKTEILSALETGDGRIQVNATWSDDGADFAIGVAKIDFGISPSDAPELKTESIVYTHEPLGDDGEQVFPLPTAAIDKKDRGKDYYVIARATDFSGRFAFAKPQKFVPPMIREPDPAEEGQPKDKPRKLDGEIRGQLLTPNGNPVSGTTFTVELQGGAKDYPSAKTTNGSFKFEGLDRDTEYTVSVPSRQYQNVGRLELPETKLKPKPPNSQPVRLKLQKEK